ncbi:MAG: DNA translocase FtsK 4TM domain-containing protein, partial [Prevotellaceae bacterium]|nr:DNA translocase FtsK 4TM domain-containing protein [Prevotellaceae bacterium]
MAVKKQTASKASSRAGRAATWRTGTGIALAVTSVYVIISIVSYFFYWDVDHSISKVSLAAGDGVHAQNLGGRLGNYLAEIFVRRWFGVTAVCIPAAAFIVALRMLRIGRLKTVKLLIILLSLMLLVPLLLGVCSGDRMALGAGLGGEYGYFIGYIWLIAMLGKFGSVMLLMVAFFLVCCYAIPNFPHRVKTLAQRIALYFCKKKEREAPAGTPTNKSDVDSDAEAEAEAAEADDSAEPDKEKEEDSITFEPDATIGVKLTITPSEDDEVEDIRSDDKKIDSGENERENEGEADGKDDEQQVDEVLVSQLPYDPKADLSRYEYPPVDLLNDYPKSAKSVSAEELEQNKDKIVRTLGHYNISISEIRATIGPTVTLYEIIPAPGVRISKIKGLENDIALSLAALGIRIIAPIPGKGTIGIEVPNQHSEIVSMHSVVKSAEFNDA